jgi:hypothetical protein
VCGPIKIIYDGRLPGNDGETLVVEKPGSMPVCSSFSQNASCPLSNTFVMNGLKVHSTGRYHFNTLLSILKYDYNLPLVHSELLATSSLSTNVLRFLNDISQLRID